MDRGYAALLRSIVVPFLVVLSLSASPHHDPESQARERFGRVPLYFEQNNGQAYPAAAFLSRAGDYTLYLQSSQAVFAFSAGGESPAAAASHTEQLRIGFRGAASVAPVGVGERQARSFYSLANRNGGRPFEARQYERVRYGQIYPGIDAVFYGFQSQLEYDFVVAPGADPGLIELAVSGTNDLALDGNGDLRLNHLDGALTMRRPIAFQEKDGEKVPVEVAYAIEGAQTVRFQLGAWDRSKPLIIDPVVTYATYYGGGLAEIPSDIVVDASGQAVIVGSSRSIDLPLTPNAAQDTLAGGRCSGGMLVPTLCLDVFAAKLNADGSDILYATYFGGTSDELTTAAALDADGNLYITGYTRSDDFPTTAGVWQPGPDEDPALADGFVIKIGAQGNVVYATFMGGSGHDKPAAIAVDSGGSAYVTGNTTSRDYPVTPGALQGQDRSDPSPIFTEAFVTKLSADGSTAVYSTYLGGRYVDRGNAIAVDPNGNAWVAGSTGSPDFLTTPGVIRTELNGNKVDAFVVKINADGTQLAFSTLLGGSADDSADRIVLDFPEGAYVAGYTDSEDFPVSAGASLALWKRSQGYAAKLNADASKLIVSTYVQGSAEDLARGPGGEVYVSGRVVLASPLAGGPPFDSCAGTVLRVFDRTLSQMRYSSYHRAMSVIDVDSTGAVFTLGSDITGSLETTLGALQQSKSGQSDAYVTKLALDLDEDAAVTCIEHSASMAAGNISPGQLISVFGSGLGPMTPQFATVNASGFLGNRLGDTRILFDGMAAPLLYVQWNQINAIAPFGVAGKTRALMQLERGGQIVAEVELPVAVSHPGLFTDSATGRGLAAVLNQDGTINSPSNPAPPGSIVSFYGTGEGQTTPPGIDGFITPETMTNLPQPNLNVRVSIAQRSAEVLYAGAAPGLVAGVFQINARIPEDTPQGEAAVNVTVGAAFNRQAVTVAVK